MGEVIATRVAYGKALAALAPKYPDLVVLDADLSGSTQSALFAKEYPDRFFNFGIAEANMMSAAAGLAACGKRVFASSFAMFAAGRAFEQVRNSIAYPRMNVTVVGSHGGVSVGEDGATHQCIEDFAIMSAIPGMMVLCPSDAYAMTQAVEELLNHDGPAYMRLGRLAVETVTDTIPGYRFKLGKGLELRPGTDVTIVANGMMLQKALVAVEILKDQGISARLLDMSTVKPIDEELVLKAAKETGCIAVTEEHTTVGGLGSGVAQFLSETYPVPVIRHGVPDVFGRSGKAADVLEYFHLTPEGIVDAAKKALAMKKS